MRRAGANMRRGGARAQGALPRLLARLTISLLGSAAVAALTLPPGSAVARGRPPTSGERAGTLVFTHSSTPAGPFSVTDTTATMAPAPRPPASVPSVTAAPAASKPSRTGGVMAAGGAPALSAARAAAAEAEPGYGCRAAIQWLTYHAAPGFEFICPAYALGHQAFTCQDVPGVCPDNGRLIVIQDPCPAAYKNEAWNSWVVEGLVSGPYDPFGWCR